MSEGFPKILIVLFILFVLSMINLIIYTHRKNKRRGKIQDTIRMEGYMKLYLHIKNGQGSMDVLLVDDMTPIHSNEVLNKAIYLSPGEHRLILGGKVKDSGIAANVLPYYTNLTPFEITVLAKKDRIATLNYDVSTQNLFVEEKEVREDGTI